MYYKLAFKSKSRLSPILFLCAGIVVFLIATVVLTDNNKNKIIGVNSKSSIVKFDIAGVTDSSISLYWRTDKGVVPKVSYSNKKDGQYLPAFDIRDTTSSQSVRRNHLIVLTSLNPATKYYFKIDNVASSSGDNKPLHFEVKTSARIDTSSTQPIYGKLVGATGRPVDNAIVMVKIDNAYPLVTTSKNDGTFLLSTCCVIDSESFTTKAIDDSDVVTMEIIDEEGNYLVIKDQFAHVSPYATDLVMFEGSRTVDNLAVKNPVAKKEKLVLGAVSSQQQNTDTFSVIYPAQLAQIAYGNPLLKGTGVAGRSVKIVIDKTSFATSTQVDEQGVWRAQLRGKLPVGHFDLIAESTDKLGNPLTVTRSFYVAKSGEQVLGEATGSATITPTVTPDVTTSPLPTITQMATPIPPTSSYVTTAPVPPVTGIGMGPIGIITASVVLIVIGLGVILIF